MFRILSIYVQNGDVARSQFSERLFQQRELFYQIGDLLALVQFLSAL